MAHNEDTETARVTGPGLGTAVRRFPVVVLALALVGAVIGAGVTLVRPASFSASARIVLGTENDVNIYRNVPAQTPAARAQAASAALGSESVRNAASKGLDGRLSAKQIEQAVTVVPSENAAIVTVTAVRGTASSAAAVANAMTNAYESVTNAQTKARGERAQAAILKQITATRAELTSIQAQRAKRSATVTKSYAGIETLAERARLTQGALRVDSIYSGLTNRAAEVSDSITALRQTLDQTRVDDTLVVNGADTLYAATEPGGSSSASLVRNTLAGLVLGLVLGVVVAWLLLERRRGAEESLPVEAPRDAGVGTIGPASSSASSASRPRRQRRASAASR